MSAGNGFFSETLVLIFILSLSMSVIFIDATPMLGVKWATRSFFAERDEGDRHQRNTPVTSTSNTINTITPFLYLIKYIYQRSNRYPSVFTRYMFVFVKSPGKKPIPIF